MEKLKCYKLNNRGNGEENIRKFGSNENESTLYQNVAAILDKMDRSKISFKEAFSKSKVDKDIIYKVYAVAAKVVNHDFLCEKIINESGIMQEFSYENKNLIKSIVSDLLWGCKTIVGSGPIINSVLNKKKMLVKLNEKHGKSTGKFQQIFFARVNTIKYTVKDFLIYLEESNFEVIETPTTYDEYLNKLSVLKPNCFMIDFHCDDLFAFSMKIKAHLWQDPLFQNSSVVIQDKSSLLPVNLLNIEQGSTVLDMCAAPGMKTVYLAAKLKGKGKIVAVDRDVKRYQTMVKMIKSFGAYKLVDSFNSDITHFKCKYEEIDFVLLDAPCSGSGMRTRLGDTDNNTSRLEKLQWLQMKLLMQALTQFPHAKRVVYSTCSINCEENESVIDEVIYRLEDELCYELIDCHQIFDGFMKGSSDYKCGNRCLKVDMTKDFSNGFFIAMFERQNKINKLEKSYSYIKVSNNKADIGDSKQNENKSADESKSIEPIKNNGKHKKHKFKCEEEIENKYERKQNMREEAPKFEINKEKRFKQKQQESMSESFDKCLSETIVPPGKKRKHNSLQCEPSDILRNMETMEYCESSIYSKITQKKTIKSIDKEVYHNQGDVESVYNESADFDKNKKYNQKHKTKDIEATYFIDNPAHIDEQINESFDCGEKVQLINNRKNVKTKVYKHKMNDLEQEDNIDIQMNQPIDSKKNRKFRNKQQYENNEINKLETNEKEEQLEYLLNQSIRSKKSKKSKKDRNEGIKIDEVTENENSVNLLNISNNKKKYSMTHMNESTEVIELEMNENSDNSKKSSTPKKKHNDQDTEVIQLETYENQDNPNNILKKTGNSTKSPKSKNKPGNLDVDVIYVETYENQQDSDMLNQSINGRKKSKSKNIHHNNHNTEMAYKQTNENQEYSDNILNHSMKSKKSSKSKMKHNDQDNDVIYVQTYENQENSDISNQFINNRKNSKSKMSHNNPNTEVMYLETNENRENSGNILNLSLNSKKISKFQKNNNHETEVTYLETNENQEDSDMLNQSTNSNNSKSKRKLNKIFELEPNKNHENLDQSSNYLLIDGKVGSFKKKVKRKSTEDINEESNDNQEKVHLENRDCLLNQSSGDVKSKKSKRKCKQRHIEIIDSEPNDIKIITDSSLFNSKKCKKSNKDNEECLFNKRKRITDQEDNKKNQENIDNLLNELTDQIKDKPKKSKKNNEMVAEMQMIVKEEVSSLAKERKSGRQNRNSNSIKSDSPYTMSTETELEECLSSTSKKRKQSCNNINSANINEATQNKEKRKHKRKSEGNHQSVVDDDYIFIAESELDQSNINKSKKSNEFTSKKKKKINEDK